MKNILISSLILASFLSPSLVLAQTTPATSAQVDELKSALITLLTQLINQLQAQIADLQSKQAQTDTTIASVSTKVDKVVENTTPKLGSVSPSPVPSSLASVLNISYACSGSRIKVDVNPNGDYTKGLFHLDRGQGISGTNWGGGSYWYLEKWPNGFTFYIDEAGNYTYTASLFDSQDKKFLERTEDISVATCQ